MHKLINRNYTPLLCVIMLLHVLVLSTSCSSNKQLMMFSDLPDSPRVILPQMQSPVALIQPDDILEIKIAGKNEATVADFNTKGGGYILSLNSVPNYLVDRNGEIELFKIGKVKIAGYTVDSAKTILKDLLKPYLLDASTVIRFVNFRFTVLGEVRSQGSFTIPNEKINILEALGYAGDLTQFAKRNNVRVIRDSSGHREVGLVNFNEKTLFTSPYYFLKRNDVVFVDGDYTAKKRAENFNRTSSIIGIATSLITLFILSTRNN